MFFSYYFKLLFSLIYLELHQVVDTGKLSHPTTGHQHLDHLHSHVTAGHHHHGPLHSPVTA